MPRKKGSRNLNYRQRNVELEKILKKKKEEVKEVRTAKNLTGEVKKLQSELKQKTFEVDTLKQKVQKSESLLSQHEGKVLGFGTVEVGQDLEVDGVCPVGILFEYDSEKKDKVTVILKNNTEVNLFINAKLTYNDCFGNKLKYYKNGVNKFYSTSLIPIIVKKVLRTNATNIYPFYKKSCKS